MALKFRRALLAITVTLTTLALGATIVPGLASAQTAPQFSLLSNIRVGRHATFDRVVLDFAGPAPSSFRDGWTRVLTADPSGRRISLPGNTFVDVSAQQSSAAALYQGPRNFTTPQLRNVRAVAITGDFEAVLSIGLGVRHRTWLHVFTLPNPSRLVIDVGR